MHRLFGLALITLILAACSQNVTPKPQSLPSPSDFTASFLDGSLQITWASVEGASSYRLERASGSVDFQTLYEGSENSYQDASVKIASSYSYRLFALTDDLESDPVSLSERVCAPLTVEAEQGTLAGAFAVLEDVQGGNASGGKFVHTPDETEISMDLPSEEHYADYCFVVEAQGDYRIKVRVGGQAGGEDSFWVSIADTDYYYTFSDLAGNVQGDTVLFDEDYVSHFDNDGEAPDSSVDPLTLTLSPGIHDLRFALRESDARLDTIELELITN